MPRKLLKGTKNDTLQSLKGMHDILPEEQPWWDKVRKAIEEIADFYNFLRIDTPILERAELFERGVGEETDIVEKEMFYVKKRGKETMVLRPEGTAGVMRAYLEHGLSHISQPLKLYYTGSMFRYEQPQLGRYREHHQVGFEILGSFQDAVYDVQVILAVFRLLESLKIKSVSINLNSLGCNQCRSQYKKKLLDYYRKLSNSVCQNCRRRMRVNPLRLLDCKNKICESVKNEAPVIIDCLCQSCRNYFKEVLEYVESLNLPYILDSYLVRGLDYYNATVFEISVEGYNVSLGGGGRYDALGALLGWRKTELPAVGGSLGIERIVEVMKLQGIVGLARPRAKVFLVQIGSDAKKKSLNLIENFRNANIKIVESLGRDSLKAQLRIADKINADIALIFGQREVFEDTIILRDMQSGNQEVVPLNKVVDEVKKRIR
jgi:histidyl-tRNA synthetase